MIKTTTWIENQKLNIIKTNEFMLKRDETDFRMENVNKRATKYVIKSVTIGWKGYVNIIQKLMKKTEKLELLLKRLNGMKNKFLMSGSYICSIEESVKIDDILDGIKLKLTTQEQLTNT